MLMMMIMMMNNDEDVWENIFTLFFLSFSFFLFVTLLISKYCELFKSMIVNLAFICYPTQRLNWQPAGNGKLWLVWLTCLPYWLKWVQTIQLCINSCCFSHKEFIQSWWVNLFKLNSIIQKEQTNKQAVCLKANFLINIVKSDLKKSDLTMTVTIIIMMMMIPRKCFYCVFVISFFFSFLYFFFTLPFF